MFIRDPNISIFLFQVHYSPYLSEIVFNEPQSYLKFKKKVFKLSTKFENIGGPMASKNAFFLIVWQSLVNSLSNDTLNVPIGQKISIFCVFEI